jgi:glycosyltransferase involved in cell wall biosynthesis
MPNIIILEAIQTVAGGQRVLLDLLPAINSAYAVTVAVPGPGPLADALHDLQIATVTLPIPRLSLVRKTPRDMLTLIASTPRLALALRSLIQRTGAELVYANSSPTFPWGTLGAALAGRPMIWHSHNNLDDRKSLLLARALAGLPSVKHIIGASASAADQFQQPGKSIVIRSGVDLLRFAPSPDLRQRFRAQLNIESHTPLIGLLGDFIPLKRQNIFLSAATQVRALHSHAVFVLVGAVRPNPESLAFQRSLQPLLEASGARVLPWPEDLVSLLNALDLLVIASTTETGPLVLFQALACGVPVITTPTGHAPELLRNSVSGRLFGFDDVGDLADNLLGWLNEPEQHSAMQRGARQLAVTELDLNVTRQKVLDVLRGMNRN